MKVTPTTHLLCVALCLVASGVSSFSLIGHINRASIVTTRAPTELNSNSEDGESEEKISLEDKMKSWEASEDELKAASLGGVIPGGGSAERSDSFDIGLYILFPFMVLSGFAFAFFPLIMDKIDVNSVGPPPTI